jgi:hypothetical protein
LVLKEQQDSEILLLFEDGSYAPADLVHGEGGQVALQVAAYTTTRGTSIRARTWKVASIEEYEGGLDIHLASSMWNLPLSGGVLNMDVGSSQDSEE